MDHVLAQPAGESSRVVQFRPGDIGISADWTTGWVLELHDGGQGEQQGVKVGWVFQSIGEEAYSRKLLDAKRASVAPYAVTFRTQSAGSQKKYYNNAMKAHNVWTLDINEDVVDEAARFFNEEVLPEYAAVRQAPPPSPWAAR